MINDEEYDQAIAAFGAAVNHNEEFVQNYIDRAVALLGQGNYTQAIAYYDMMIRLNPNDPTLLRARGVAYAMQGEYERATVDLKEAVTLDSNYGDAFIDLADVYRNWGESINNPGRRGSGPSRCFCGIAIEDATRLCTERDCFYR